MFDPDNPPDKKSIRDKIFGEANKRRQSQIIEVFGTSIEVRQPKVRDILSNKAEEDRSLAVFNILRKYAYVPKTDNHVFEDTDYEAFLELPFDKDLTAINDVIEEMLGIEKSVEDAEKNSKATV